jgi:hypothetical protein
MKTYCYVSTVERTVARMICGIKLRDRKWTDEVMSMLQLIEDIVALVR